MTLFLDNDALQKLAILDLLAETVALAPPARVAVLGTARFRAGKAGKKKWGEQITSRVLTFIESCETVDAEPVGVERFQNKPGLDPGEVLLILAATNDGASVLWTGDKRCLIALAADTDLADLTAKLAGRVLCFEQLILRLIDKHGFAYVLAKVVGAPSGWDRSVEAVAFGSGAQATEPNTRAALESYVADLRAKTGGLLAP